MTAPAVAALAEHARAIAELGRQTVKNVVEIGRRLSECRALLKEDQQWRAWLKNQLRLSPQTAGRFIQVYELSGDVPRLERLELPVSSLYLLAAPSTPPEVRAEIIERAEAGEQVTTTEVKTAIAKRKPEPKPKQKYKVNPAAAALFANEDQLHAFAAVMRTPGARRLISFEQQVDFAKELTEGNIRAAAYQSWVSDWLRQAGKLQGRIDVEERDDIYKQFPGYEIRDEVAEAKSATRSLVASLLRLEDLSKKLPHHPFFGDLGSTLDDVINMIRQYRRTAGEKSTDEVERKLAQLAELERKTGTQESIIEELRRELEEAKAAAPTLPRDDIGPDSASEAERLRVRNNELERDNGRLETKVAGLETKVTELERENEELRAKLATATGGGVSVSEFQTAHKQWEDAFEELRGIIAQRDNEIASLRAQVAAPASADLAQLREERLNGDRP
jgi:uncharacterized protein YukE